MPIKKTASARQMNVLRTALPTGLCLLLFAFTLFGVALPSFRDCLFDAKREMIRELTHSVWTLMSDYDRRYREGELTLEEAQDRAIKRIRELRYGPEQKDYFWILDSDVNMIMHPYRPEFENTNMRDFADSEGNRLIVMMVEIATNQGSGYVNYYWQRKDQDETNAAKLSYVKLFEPWGYVIGTGFYLDEVARSIAMITKRLNVIFGVILLVVVGLSLYIIFHGLKVEKQAQLAALDLLHSEEQFRAIFNQTFQFIAILDMSGKVLDINDATLQRFCLHKNKLLKAPLWQTDWWRCFEDPKGRQLQQSIQKAAEGGLGRFELCGKQNHHAIWVDFSVKAVQSENHPGLLVIEGRDITDHKQAEAAQIDLERQVQHAQKLESLGVLAGGIAHDFNNILMAILGNADLALTGISPYSPARNNLQEIEKAARRAADLARQMLAYSGKGRFVVQPIQLNELVHEMAHLLEVSISKKVVLKYNFADNLPCFEGDITQIRQVVLNLITNASESIGEQSGVIALSTGAMYCDRPYLDDVNELVMVGLEEPLQEHLYVYLEVADTGCGMDKETLAKIFDPFFTTKFTGRGLGMSAVLGIMRGHRGAIKIYSEVGQGTSFKILFPATEEIAPLVADGNQSQTDHSDWQGEGTVLVIDDEETVCAVGRQMLEHLGFQVLVALDGREGVEVFRAHSKEVRCVLLDLTMPHMDGEETFRELRRISPEVRVVLSSGYNMQDATQRFAGKGLAGFIQKPYKIVALKETLMKVL